MWGIDYDKKITEGKDESPAKCTEPDNCWWNYRREESENGKFNWIRMFGGEVTARNEDTIILESWYQKTFKS